MGSEQSDLLYEVLAFDWVKTRKTEGGTDKANVARPLEFELALEDGWKE